MARIKLGPLVTDIGGSIGGLTIQRNKFGYTMRSKPLPLYSETPAQYNIRKKIVFLQYSWQNFTDAQRLQWNRFLDFSGQTIRRDRSIKLSGQGLFIKYNLWRLMVGQSILSPIAYSPMPDIETLVKIAVDTGPVYYLNFTGYINTAIYYFVCKLSSPRLEAQAFNPRGLRFMYVGFQAVINFNIGASYVAAFGVMPSVGDFLHYSIQYWSTVSPVYSGVYTGIVECIAI